MSKGIDFSASSTSSNSKANDSEKEIENENDFVNVNEGLTFSQDFQPPKMAPKQSLPYSKAAAAPQMDFVMKVLFLGDCSVGKTSLIHRYVNKTVSQNYKPTIGADFHNKTIHIVDQSDGLTKNITLQLWDTAGQERFNSLSKAFYRGTECCMLVFDLTNRESFDNIA